MPAYHRTQILLEPTQHQYLQTLAEEEQQSISAIVREIIDEHYRAKENDEEELRQRRLAAIESMRKFREKLAARHPEPLPDPVDLLNEMREERMQDFERIWRGEE